MDPFGDDNEMTNFEVPADNSLYEGENSFMSNVDQTSSYTAPSMSFEQQSAPGANSLHIPEVEEENELTKFMAKYEEEVAKKAAEQEKVAVECREKAKVDMEKFLADRAAAKDAKQQSNRVYEQTTLEKMAADLESENPWERVVSLVDLESNRKQRLAALNSSKKDSKKDSKKETDKDHGQKKDEEVDVSRMRQLFVQLKAEPLEHTRAQAAH